jgi:ethanolamine utilization cobalamin adenosyltransferase
MLYTEEAVKDNLRNREGRRVFYLGKNDTLTPGAKDYLTSNRIEILPASQAKQEEYALLGGGFCREKPEHMTHLNAQLLVPKTHPRICFRGAMDTLEAELILAELECSRETAGNIRQILTFAREIVASDVLENSLERESLCGLTWEEVRKHSHFPQEYYHQPHFMPNATDGKALAQINRARCAARAAELWGNFAFQDRDGRPTRQDLLLGLNRISSMLYILMIREKAAASR